MKGVPVEVICDDGNNKFNCVLKQNDKGILLPSGIWSEQKYIEDKTNIIVFCDNYYDELDYIRNYQEFLEWRKKKIENSYNRRIGTYRF